jgi:hypothetical protein
MNTMMEKTFRFKVKIQSPEDGRIVKLSPVATFSYNPDDYGNGWHMLLEGAGLIFDYYDCRYDHRLDPEDLPAYARLIMKEDVWSGQNGSWKLKEITEICY